MVKGEPELLAEINRILDVVSEEHLYLDWLDAANEQAASLPRSIP